MDLEAAKQTSREGFRDSHETCRQILAELGPEGRADIDQCAAAIRTTLETNGIACNRDTAEALYMGVALVSAELQGHHGGTYPGPVCIEAHILRPELACQAFLDQQGGS